MGNSGDDFVTIPTAFWWFAGAVVTLMVCIVVAAAGLRDRGLITPEEYQARRAQVLDGI